MSDDENGAKAGFLRNKRNLLACPEQPKACSNKKENKPQAFQEKQAKGPTNGPVRTEQAQYPLTTEHPVYIFGGRCKTWQGALLGNRMECIA